MCIRDSGYVVDLSTIEQDMTTGLSEKEDIQFADHVTQDATTQNAPTDDLDYDPYFQETNSGNVENPDISGSESMSDGVKEGAKQEADTENREEKKENAAETGNVEGGDQEALSTAMQPALNFTDEDTPVSYTQLDVYKRQPILQGGMNENQFRYNRNGIRKNLFGNTRTDESFNKI